MYAFFLSGKSQPYSTNEEGNESQSRCFTPPQKIVYYSKPVYIIILNVQKRQLYKTESKLVDSWDWEGEQGWTVHRQRCYWENENVLKLIYDGGCTTW